MNVFYVYVHMKPDLTPFYVGKGTKRRAYDKSNRNRWHRNITNKYGWENIIVEIKYCQSEQAAFFNEKLVIEKLKNKYPCLTNLTDGGEGPSGYRHSEETRSKWSVSRKGRKLSEEQKRKISEASRNMPAEVRNKISEANKGKLRTPEQRAKISVGRKGIVFSENTRMLMSAAAKKRPPMSKETRDKLSIISSSRKYSEKFKEKHRLLRWVCNSDGSRKYINVADLEEFLANGWVQGMKYKSPS